MFLMQKIRACASKCFSLKKSENNVKIEEIKVVGNVLKEKNSERFLRKVKIGPLETLAHVDMGASVCTIKASVVLRCGFNIIRTESTLEGFGGKEVQSMGVVREEFSFENLRPRK